MAGERSLALPLRAINGKCGGMDREPLGNRRLYILCIVSSGKEQEAVGEDGPQGNHRHC